MHAPAPRHPWIDALRALALLGVFIVNAVGYAQAPVHPQPLGSALPADAPVALLVHTLLLALVQGKAWSLLCFLFGYSLGDLALRLRATGHRAQTRLRQRYRKLLLVGVLHGVLLYFGDILTLYALCGLLVAHWATVRPAHLLRIWRRACVLVGLLIAVPLLLLLGTVGLGLSVPAEPMALDQALLHAPTLAAFWARNADAYLWAHIASVFWFLPLLLWLTLSGLLARRLGLLGPHRHARRFWARYLGPRQLGLALLANAAIALAAAWMHLHHTTDTAQLGLQMLLGIASGIWLAATGVGWCMRRMHAQAVLPHWVAWLAPAGQHTLAMYLVLSLALVLGRPALRGLEGATVPTLVLAVAAWWLAVCAARWATRQGLRDPVSRWLSRRT